jgi:hypothetical protein
MGGKQKFAANAKNKPRVVKADVGHPRERTMSYPRKPDTDVNCILLSADLQREGDLMSKRKQQHPELKAKVAPEALKCKETVSELAFIYYRQCMFTCPRGHDDPSMETRFA